MNDLIGNTPIVKINYKYLGEVKYIYAKLEWYNFTGSIKDIVVSFIIDKNIKSGNIKDDTVLVEATSGNTGISLSAIGARYKHKVVIFIPSFVSQERIDLMKSFGAEVHLISKEEGGFKRCLLESQKYAALNKAFLLNQFYNEDNVMAHFLGTGSEIISAIPLVDGFVCGVGSGGTLMGVSSKIKDKNRNAYICAVEPKNSPLLSTGFSSQHKIEGISDDFVPGVFDKDLVDEYLLVDEVDAINMASILAKKLGLGVGISSGANFLGAVYLNRRCKNVVTIFADDNKKYLSTDLVNKDYSGQKLISNDIELISFEVM